MKQLRTWLFFGGKRINTTIYYYQKHKGKIFTLSMIIARCLLIEYDKKISRNPQFGSLQKMKDYVRLEIKRQITTILND